MMLETLDHYYPMQRPSIEDSPGQENIILEDIPIKGSLV